jgi:hypothetical protein
LRNVLAGFLYSFAAAVAFSLLASLAICVGADPGTRAISDFASPLLGVFVGAGIASHRTSWKTGFEVGLLYVFAWFVFWMYVMDRWNVQAWVQEGMPRLSLSHASWWCAGVLAGLTAGLLVQRDRRWFIGVLVIALLGWSILIAIPSYRASEPLDAKIPGFQVERNGPTTDGTMVYLTSFDFQKSAFKVCIYDCDDDDVKADNDSNTTYMGQSLPSLIEKLNRRRDPARQRVLCAINGGFFGASGFSVAHHEEPIVEDGRARYDVDLLRPKDQSCFFAVNSPEKIHAGQPRFVMASSIPWQSLPDYQTVLGGVRPLCIDGRSLPLAPGAGSTTLRCSRTSVGWSADGAKLYILIVQDPDGELASQIQRRLHQPQTGGWDVREVQEYWEKKQVPFAVLFDGGESTQLALDVGNNHYRYVPSGYQYSFTIGYLFQRPLRLTFPILPPTEAHRGV